MRNLKQAAAFILIGVLALSAFAGCSGATEQPSSGPAASTATEPASSAGAAESGSAAGDGSASLAAGKAPGQLPIVDEPYTLRIFAPQDPQVLDYYNNKLTEYLLEKTGVSVEFNLVLSKDISQKLNLILATGQDLPDVFMSAGIDNSILMEYAQQGVFVPLNDYIDNVAHYFKAPLEDLPELRGMMTAPDGNIYSLPALNVETPNMMATRMWINQVWLDALNLSMPTTLDEYVEVLRAFKTQDPNGNGLQDEIPLMGSTNGWNGNVEPYFLNSFLRYPNTASSPSSTTRYTVTPDGKLGIPYIQEEFREGIKFLNSLVTEGLLDPSSFTQDVAQLRQIFETEEAARVGTVTSGGPNAHANMNGGRFKDYVTLPPLEGPSGVRYTNYNPYTYLAPLNCWVITRECKDPEVAFRFADFMYEKEASMFTRMGEPGVDFVDAEPGEIGVNGEPATHRMILVYGTDQTSHWQHRNPHYNNWQDWAVRDEENPYDLMVYLWDVAEQYKPYLPPKEECLPPLMYTADEARELNEINSVLNQYLDETRVRWVTGGNIDSEWDAYLAELEKMGMNRVVEIMQAAYDRFAAAS